ncbi:MAG: hypothetical protein AAF799_21050 [Myxococcota bacterium]
MQSSEPKGEQPSAAPEPGDGTNAAAAPGPTDGNEVAVAAEQTQADAPATVGSTTPPPPADAEALAMNSALVPVDEEPRAQRWRLVRDMLVFQCKILVDGLKDLVLGPVALAVGAMDLLSKSERPGQNFYKVMRWGRDFDRWVDLFGEKRRAALTDGTPTPTGTPNQADPEAAPLGSDGMDAYLSRFERVVLDHYKKGGITAKAKDAIDKAIDAVQDGTDSRR